jgi:phosphoribosylanthranilate isomerase
MLRPVFFAGYERVMASTRIKICGITTPDDARLAIDSGADAIGLVFYADSPRAVTIEDAAKIAAAVPPFVSLVALFVDEPLEHVQRILSHVPIDLLQFHGVESPQYCQQFDRPWIKALRVKPGLDIQSACGEYISARGVLLDSWQPGVPGGTGKRFDWGITPRDLPLPLVLAGGLSADNVGSAVHQLRPAAVDVSGGVESAPGKKDADKISKFIAAVRIADQQLDGIAHDD